MEFMERSAIALAQEFTGDFSLQMEDDVQAHLLIEVDAFRLEDLLPQMELILPVLESCGAKDPLFADDAASQEKLWFLRRRVGEAVKAASIYKEEDTVVPRAKLPDLLAAVKRTGKKFGFESVCYGHAGDGNLHVNIMKGTLSDSVWNEQLPIAIRMIFKAVVELGGTLSGEHGIGWVQKDYMDIAFSPRHLELMHGVKRVFDPKGILNPEKILPPE
jgi:glycolate oxidase